MIFVLTTSTILFAVLINVLPCSLVSSWFHLIALDLNSKKKVPRQRWMDQPISRFPYALRS